MDASAVFNPEKGLLTVPDVARRLGISTRSTWTLIALGHLPVIRLGSRATRVDPDDVEKLIARRKTPTKA